MRCAVWAVLATAGLAVGHAPAAAATFVIMTDPMTLDRRMVVMDTPGRDRVLMCSMPPAVAGCREIAIRQRRR